MKRIGLLVLVGVWAVLTISAMSGYLPISQWIRQYSENG